MKKYTSLLIALGSLAWAVMFGFTMAEYVRNFTYLPELYGWYHAYDYVIVIINEAFFVGMAFMFGFKAWGDLKK